MSQPRFSAGRWPEGLSTAAINGRIADLNSAQQTISCFTRDEPGLTPLWSRTMSCDDPGVPVAEPMAFPGEVWAQMYIQPEVFDHGLGDETRNMRYVLGCALIDNTGAITDVFGCSPNAPMVVAGMDCSRYDPRTWTQQGPQPTSWNAVKGNFVGTIGQNVGFLDFVGDGLCDQGRVAHYEDLFAEAPCFGFISFPAAGIIVPQFSEGQSILGVNIESKSVAWRLEGFTTVPAAVASRDIVTLGAVPIPAFGELEWTRTFYTAVCEDGPGTVLVHFTEIDFTLPDVAGGVGTGVKRDRTDCAEATGYFTTPGLTVSALAWLSVVAFGTNFPAPLHPDIYFPTNPIGQRCRPYPAGGTSGDYPNAKNIADLESVLDEAFMKSFGENQASPIIKNVKHGYLILDVKTGAQVSKAYYDDEVTHYEVDGIEKAVTYDDGGQGFWTGPELVNAISTAHFIQKNTFPDPCPSSQPPCEHGIGGCGAADDAEVAFPSPIRFCRPNPSGPSFTWFDMLYPAKVTSPGYRGGEFLFSLNEDPDEGPNSNATPQIALTQGVLMLREVETNAPSEFIEAGWSASDTSFNKPPAYGVVGLGDPVAVPVNRYRWYRFYTSVTERKYNKPMRWHSGKLAKHPGDDVYYGFGRANPHAVLLPSKFNTSALEAFEVARHNDEVAAGIQGVWELSIGGSISINWFKNFHDIDVVGPPPDQVVADAFGTVKPGLKEPRHGSICSSPFITDNQIVCVVEDWSAVTQGGLSEPLGIKRFVVVLDRTSEGAVLHKYEIVGDALPQETNHGPSQFTGYGWPHDTLILANCELHGQHLALNWSIPEDPP